MFNVKDSEFKKKQTNLNLDEESNKIVLCKMFSILIIILNII